MAFVIREIESRKLSAEAKAVAERKITRWFIGAVLTRRYQQSTHDKQARDKVEIVRWLDGSDEDSPQWIKDAFIPNLKLSDPDSALGKLMRAINNRNAIKDPLTGKAVGVGSGKQASAKHHIFPTKFVKNMKDWNEKEDSSNLALNVMMCEQSTNASWLNLDPLIQLENTIKVHGASAVEKMYLDHGINAEAFKILRKSKKSKKDFLEFLGERENYFVQFLQEWGFVKPVRADADADEIVED